MVKWKWGFRLFGCAVGGTEGQTEGGWCWGGVLTGGGVERYVSRVRGGGGMAVRYCWGTVEVLSVEGLWVRRQAQQRT